MSDESIKPPTLNYFDNCKFWVEFNGSCVKADGVSFFSPNEIVNVYIAFEIKSLAFYVENKTM